MMSTQVHAGLLPHPMDTSNRMPSVHRVIGTAYDHTSAAPICRPSSDCGGSSSGLGGMTKTDIVSSDDSSLASDAPMAAKGSWSIQQNAVVVNGVPPIPYMPCSQGPTSSNSPSPMFAEQGRNMFATVVQRTSASSSNSNDLFVHVQTGETLSILVGTDVHQITGPATVRMVNQAGASAALPLHVPPGHMVQQILDEQGVLRHLILSPESTPAAHLHAGTGPPITAVNASRSSNPPLKFDSSLPPVVPSFPPPTLPYNVHNNVEGSEELSKKQWQGKKAASQANSTPLIANSYNDEHELSQSGASANEDDEWERLGEMLSKVQPPRVLREGARDVDLAWQELDTSEAAASGGPFPQIDASEFSYEIVVFENSENGPVVHSYRCEPGNGNHVVLKQLRPNTLYYVHLRASLEERGLQGSPSPSTSFRTLRAVPEAPLISQEPVARSHNSLTIRWSPPVDNGLPIRLYRVELFIEKGKGGSYKVVYEGLEEKSVLTGLSPLTKYRIRLIAINDEGESKPSPEVTFQTLALPQPPSAPKPPQLAFLSSKTVKLSWTMLANHQYSLQMSEAACPSQFCILLERAHQDYFAMNDLPCNRQYHFRLVAHNEAGDSEPSEPLIIRTPRFPSSPSNSPPATPTKLRARNVDSRLEIGWKPASTSTSDKTEYVLEGSTDDPPKNWCVVYKGNATSTIICDSNLCAFRVSACRFQSQSNWSEVLTLRKRERRLAVVSKCEAPRLKEISDGCVRVEWNPVNTVQSSKVRYCLRTMKPQLVDIYKGEETSFEIRNCLPGSELEVQVRAVLIKSDSSELEGEWSDSSTLRVAPLPPLPPVDVFLDTNNDLHWMPSATDNGAPITEYLVERVIISKPARVLEEERECESSTEWTSRTIEAAERSLYVGDGKYGCKYQLSVCAINAGGKSVPSQCVYLFIPPDVPSPPLNFQINAQGCGQLRASWCVPVSNGSELKGYRLVVKDKDSNEQICEKQLSSTDTTDDIEDLVPDHLYKLMLYAFNDVGESLAAVSVARTPPPPPLPPILTCAESSPSVLKLKWKPVGVVPSSSQFYFYLERENDNGKFSRIFEGERRYCSVRFLTEGTKYRFRIRCGTRLSGAGDWSEPYEFSTAQPAPPGIRGPVVVNEVGPGCFQIEWQPVRMSSSNFVNDNIFYRLEMAYRNLSSIQWKTIYEGSSTSYSLSTSENAHLRIRTVRVRNGVESVSPALPVEIVVPSNSSLSLNPKSTNDKCLTDTEKLASSAMSNMQRIQYYLFSDTHYALAILIVFVLVACAVALCLNAFFIQRN